MYRSDRDWIDGELSERNRCEMPHSTIQGFLIQTLRNQAKQWAIRVLPEQRVRTSQEHYRIADICVVHRHAPYEPIVHEAPLLCIESLSRDDSMTEIPERIDDYFGMGVQAAWVIDPHRRRAFLAREAWRARPGARGLAREDGSLEAANVSLTVANTPISISVAELFAELDEAEALGKAPETA